MKTFDVTTKEGIQDTKQWVLEIFNSVETASSISEYSDKAFGWLATLIRIQAMARSRLIKLDMELHRRSAVLLSKNVSAMSELKYRVLDMLCSTDELYVNLLEEKEKVVEINSMTFQLIQLFDMVLKTTNKLIDLRKNEEYATASMLRGQA